MGQMRHRANRTKLDLLAVADKAEASEKSEKGREREMGQRCCTIRQRDNH